MAANLSGYKAIEFRRENRVLYATFNRPETLNAIDKELHDDLSRLFRDVADDAETNVLVITGAGRAFSAGGDIEAMQRAIDEPAEFLAGLENGKELIFSILDCPKPTIAKVNGAAMGLGATIALFCDIVFADRQAKIADPHVKLGFNAGDGGAIIWPALIGYAQAKAFLFTGDALTGEEAERLGLIYRSAAAEDLDKTVAEFAERLAKGAPRAIQWTKRILNLGLKQMAQASLDASLAYEGLANLTKDHQEAVNAFREKRKPHFTGE